MVWDAAIVLSKYLETIKHVIKNKTVLEVGAGTGAVGVCAAVLEARHVLITDQDNLVEFMKHNIDLNKKVINPNCNIEAHPLVWGNQDQVD